MKFAALLAVVLLVTAPVQAADTAKGGKLYQVHCASCHGVEGRASMPGAPSFDRGNALLRPDLVLLATIRAGKNAMPAYQGRLPDKDIMDVIAFMRTLH